MVTLFPSSCIFYIQPLSVEMEFIKHATTGANEARALNLHMRNFSPKVKLESISKMNALGLWQKTKVLGRKSMHETGEQTQFTNQFEPSVEHLAFSLYVTAKKKAKPHIEQPLQGFI